MTAAWPMRSNRSPSSLASASIAASTSSRDEIDAAVEAGSRLAQHQRRGAVDDRDQFRHGRGQVARARGRMVSRSVSSASGGSARKRGQRRAGQHDVHETRLRERAAHQQVGLAGRDLGPEFIGGLDAHQLQAPVERLADIARRIGAHLGRRHAEHARCRSRAAGRTRAPIPRTAPVPTRRSGPAHAPSPRSARLPERAVARLHEEVGLVGELDGIRHRWRAGGAARAMTEGRRASRLASWFAARQVASRGSRTPPARLDASGRED